MSIERYIPYPQGALKRVMHFPVWAYAFGLGNLFDALGVLVLTTRGAKTGLTRHTPVNYHVHGSKVYIVSAWGKRPAWYHNLVADPNVTVQRGSTIYAGVAQPVTNSGEALRVLHLFRRRAPALYDSLIARLSDRDAIDQRTLHEVTDQFTIVRIERAPGPSPLAPVPVVDGWMPLALGGAALAAALTATWVVLRIIRRRP